MINIFHVKNGDLISMAYSPTTFKVEKKLNILPFPLDHQLIATAKPRHKDQLTIHQVKHSLQNLPEKTTSMIRNKLVKLVSHSARHSTPIKFFTPRPGYKARGHSTFKSVGQILRYHSNKTSFVELKDSGIYFFRF